ncbi:MAG TPA: DNA primase [Burkholderiales bacterium]|nr:DNA primase [Burkholderiales bacterium]
MIARSFIRDLLHRVDIVAVIEQHMPLKKAGANYIARCPFHNEKTPSFTVSPAKQFYHCFGCGAHGNAIDFVMEQTGMGFAEAVRDLAANVGMKVIEEKSDAPSRKRDDNVDLPALMLQAAHYYKNALKQSETAIAYLKKRGLSGEIAARFGIGYAPPGWQNLASVFSNYQDKALLATGLVKENEEGRRYDVFRDRIMFPIWNDRGTIIGFGGRVLDGAASSDPAQEGPKYLNSPETPLFEKGRELYGLFQARKAIREAGKVVIVEGYMDVLALVQNGIAYAVATLGTATTGMHVQKLLRHSDNLVFCFDGDDAGRRAAWRALENSLSQITDGTSIGFLFLPQGEDPDSFVRKNGREGFEKLLGETVPLSALLLRELASRVDLKSEEGRARFLQSAKPLLTRITAPALGLMLRKRLAELAGVSQSELEALYQIKLEARPQVPQKFARKTPSLARKILQLLLYQPQLAANFDAAVPESPHSEFQALKQLLEFMGNDPHIEHSGVIIEWFRGTAHEALLREVGQELFMWEEKKLGDEDMAREFAGALSQLRELERNSKIDALRSKSEKQELSSEEKILYQQLLKREAASVEDRKSSAI